MPFPRTWSEELIAESLELDGFLTQTNIPVGTGGPGGRNEADIVGVRIKEGTLEIRHVETGSLAGGQKSTASVEKKFTEDIESNVTEYFKRTLSLENPKKNYKKIYVATSWTKPVIRDVTELGVEVIRLPDFIRDKVLPTVQNWKENTARQLRMKGSSAMLPQSLWLLQMLDYLETQGMLQEERQGEEVE